MRKNTFNGSFPFPNGDASGYYVNVAFCSLDKVNKLCTTAPDTTPGVCSVVSPGVIGGPLPDCSTVASNPSAAVGDTKPSILVIAALGLVAYLVM